MRQAPWANWSIRCDQHPQGLGVVTLSGSKEGSGAMAAAPRRAELGVNPARFHRQNTVQPRDLGDAAARTASAPCEVPWIQICSQNHLYTLQSALDPRSRTSAPCKVPWIPDLQLG